MDISPFTGPARQHPPPSVGRRTATFVAKVAKNERLPCFYSPVISAFIHARSSCTPEEEAANVAPQVSHVVAPVGACSDL